MCGIELPEGLTEASRLDPPIFTPATKAAQGEHDENVSVEYVAERLGRGTATPPRIDRASLPTVAGDPSLIRQVLDNLIGNNTRLMSFVASLDEPSAEFPYLMDQFTYVFENDFENVSPSNYSCNPSRPSAVAGNPSTALESGRMFLQNHFLYVIEPPPPPYCSRPPCHQPVCQSSCAPIS